MVTLSNIYMSNSYFLKRLLRAVGVSNSENYQIAGPLDVEDACLAAEEGINIVEVLFEKIKSKSVST